MQPSFDRTMEDLGNAIHFEHVNVTVPDQRLATLFYVAGLVRSATHPMYLRPLVNRNPAQTNRTYAPGHEQWASAMGPDQYDDR